MELSIANATVFADGLDHPECVAVHPDGSVWAGGEAGQLYRIRPDGQQMDIVARTGGFILGIAISPCLRWMAVCDLGNHCVWRFDFADGKLSRFADGAEGHRFNIPNYATFDTAGNLYVSESGAFRQVNGKILKFAPDGTGTVWSEGPFHFANGLALGPEEKHLYVAVSFLPGVERIEITPQGAAGRRELCCTLPESVPDGLAFDAAGNLYVSCYAPNKIFKVLPAGDCQVWLSDWEAHTLSNPTNIAFGGPQLDQLFAANLGRWHITRIDAGVRGLPLASHAGIGKGA
jgi:gluconolactonase